MNIEPGEKKSFWLSANGLALVVFLAAAAYFLWTEHRAHVVSFLPYTLLLLCVGMHFFMHRGHGGHGGGGAADHPEVVARVVERRERRVRQPFAQPVPVEERHDRVDVGLELHQPLARVRHSAIPNAFKLDAVMLFKTLGKGHKVGRVHGKPVGMAGIADDLIARHGRAALSECHQHVVLALDDHMGGFGGPAPAGRLEEVVDRVGLETTSKSNSYGVDRYVAFTDCDLESRAILLP